MTQKTKVPALPLFVTPKVTQLEVVRTIITWVSFFDVIGGGGGGGGGGCSLEVGSFHMLNGNFMQQVLERVQV
jgi:hypothetical protein